MPSFVPIQLFQGLYGSYSELLTPEGIEAFLKKLNSDASREIIENQQIATADFEKFVAILSDPINVLFFEWVEQDTALNLLLSGGKLSFFVDEQQHLKHQYGDRYKGFLSPYLCDELLKYSEENSEEILFQAFSFVQLLDDQNRAVVEGELFKGIRSDLEKTVNEIAHIETEQDLIDMLKPLCSDYYIGCVNALSRESYYLKLLYVDSILGVIRSGSCTYRFANWILKRMELVLLNNEHQNRIIDLRKELREGKLTVKNHGTGKSSFQWKNVLFGLFIAAVIAGVFCLVYYKPFSEVETKEFISNASFKKFTVEERRKIDSLLQIMNANRTLEDELVDQGLPIYGQSSSLTIRKEFKNDLMEKIYQDLVLDAEIQERGVKDSCLAEIKYKRLADVEALESKKGKIEVMIKNESEYKVVLFVSQNNSGGETHSTILKNGETITFKIDQFNTIMAVAGNHYQNYSPPIDAQGGGVPSDEYKYHFCETDYNYKESINKVYKVIKGTNSQIKLMLNGNKGGYFDLIDINGALEEY